MERFLDFQFRREIKLLPLFFNQSFRAIAVSLFWLFSIIYIYKTFLAITGTEKIALLVVFTYLLGAHVFKFISNLFAEELALKLGLKRQIYLGLFFLALSSAIFALSSNRPYLFVLASPLWGVSMGFYWFGRHGLMAKMGRDGAFGKQLGILDIISTIFLLLVPFLGGVLISLAGYPALFLTALLFVILAGLVIMPLEDQKTRVDTSLNEVFSLFKTHQKTLLAYVGTSVSGNIYGVVLPLYLFLILKKELVLGEFFSLSMIMVALINLIIGRWADLKGKRGLIAYGSILQFLVWLGRTLTKSIGALFTFDIIDRIGGGMVGIPMSVLSYQKAVNGHSTGRAMLFRETAITGGGILSDCLMILLVALGGGFRLIFLVAAFFSLFPLLIVGRPKTLWQGSRSLPDGC